MINIYRSNRLKKWKVFNWIVLSFVLPAEWEEVS